MQHAKKLGHFMPTLALVGLAAALFVAPAAASTPETDDGTARLALSRPVTVSEVATELDRLNVDQVELISEDVIGDMTYTSGVVFDGGELSSDAYVRESVATFNDMSTELEASASSRTSGADLLTSAKDLELTAESIGAVDARITGMVVTASDDALNKLSSWSLVSAFAPIAADSMSAPNPQTRSGVTTQDAGSGGDCSDPWWPFDGRVSTQYSSTQPDRYVWQNFVWSQWRIDNLYACDGAATSYEHEAWFNNYDDHTFLSDDVHAWSSSMPDPYIDTGFADIAGELSMTVGTGAAYQLDEGVYYTTYIRTAPGNTSSDAGKVNGQRGFNTCPIGATGGWCVYARATEKLLPAWQHSAPGADDWWHY